MDELIKVPYKAFSFGSIEIHKVLAKTKGLSIAANKEIILQTVMVVQAFSPSPLEAGAGRAELEVRESRTTKREKGVLHREALS